MEITDATTSNNRKKKKGSDVQVIIFIHYYVTSFLQLIVTYYQANSSNSGEGSGRGKGGRGGNPEVAESSTAAVPAAVQISEPNNAAISISTLDDISTKVYIRNIFRVCT